MVPEIISSTPECEIVSERIVNASVELVYTAWADPNHLKNWWGPLGFTNTFNEFDLRPGGKWRFIMHGPDKGNFLNECEFIKVKEPTLITWKRFSKPIFQVAVTFEQVSAHQTKIIFIMTFNTADECNKVKVIAVDKNEESFDRLESELATMARESAKLF